MSQIKPVGENNPPQFVAPKNEALHGGETGTPQSPLPTPAEGITVPESAAAATPTPPQPPVAADANPATGSGPSEGNGSGAGVEQHSPQTPGASVPPPSGAANGRPSHYGYGPAGLPAGSVYGQLGAPAGNAGGAAPYSQAVPAPVSQAASRQPFTATSADRWFAVGCLVLGVLFVNWLFFSMPLQGWGVTAFTVLFGLFTLGYAWGKEIKPKPTSWFWFAVLQLTGLTYALWPAGSMGFYQGLLLFGSAVYWCASALGGLLAQKTGNYLFFEALNLLLCIPFRNFGIWFKSLARPAGGRGEAATNGSAAPAKRGRLVWALLLGVLLCLPLLAVLLPLLLEADAGPFNGLMIQVLYYLEKLFSIFDMPFIFRSVFGFPVALYLFGLIAGIAHRRYISNIDLKRVEQAGTQLRLVPNATIFVVLGMVSVLYLVFIGCQMPYFFSAFMGQRPSEYQVYSSYARDGFFELCRIAAINLALLTASNLLCRTKRLESAWLKGLNILLSVLTLLVITTAFSKMALYINAYGLTPKRVMSCVFMVFLAGVFVANIVLQYKAFSIMRFAAVYGTVLLCALCLVNLDALVTHYNANRYLDGSLPSFDVTLLEQTKSNGIFDAIRVYEAEEDIENRKELWNKIAFYAKTVPSFDENSSRDCLWYMLLRRVKPAPRIG